MIQNDQEKQLQSEKNHLTKLCENFLSKKSKNHPNKISKPVQNQSPQIVKKSEPERSKKIQKGSKPETTPNVSTNRKIMMKMSAKNISPRSIFLISLMPIPTTFSSFTPIVALDCEMVVCSDTERHIARISIVNYNRHTLFDEFVKPELPVKDYLNHITNIDSFKLQKALPLSSHIGKILEIFKNRIVVGHTLECDFSALKIEHDPRLIRDISEFSFFKNEKYKIGLKDLTERYLNMKIQDGKHSSVEDARAALELYKLYKEDVDCEFKDRFFNKEKKDEGMKAYK